MSETGTKINRSLFGGYNRRSVDAYIDEMQSLIVELQVKESHAEKVHEQYKSKLQEVKTCYTELWEHSKEQEETIQAQKGQLERQKNEIKVNGEVIQNLKDKIQTRSDTIRRQEDELKMHQETVQSQGDKLKQQRQVIEVQKEELGKLKAACEEKESEIALLEKQMQEYKDSISDLKDKLEKHQWVHEGTVKNIEGLAFSHLERFIKNHIRNSKKL